MGFLIDCCITPCSFFGHPIPVLAAPNQSLGMDTQHAVDLDQTFLQLQYVLQLHNCNNMMQHGCWKFNNPFNSNYAKIAYTNDKSWFFTMLFSTFCVFPYILSMFSTAFYFLLVQLHGGKLRAELSELRASLGAQVYLKGKLSIIKPTLESVWKFTQITRTVDLKPFSVGWRWKWLTVEPMISILRE